MSTSEYLGQSSKLLHPALHKLQEHIKDEQPNKPKNCLPLVKIKVGAQLGTEERLKG